MCASLRSRGDSSHKQFETDTWPKSGIGLAWPSYGPISVWRWSTPPATAYKRLYTRFPEIRILSLPCAYSWFRLIRKHTDWASQKHQKQLWWLSEWILEPLCLFTTLELNCDRSKMHQSVAFWYKESGRFSDGRLIRNPTLQHFSESQKTSTMFFQWLTGPPSSICSSQSELQ